MRLKYLAVAVAAVAATAFAPNRADAQPAKAPEPTIEVRVRSVNDLVTKFEYVAGLVGQDEPAKQVRELLKQLAADGKGIEGVDPKRPFGVYATLAGDVVNSPVIVMIPVADQDRFLKMLKDRLGVEPEKVEGGSLKAHLPLLPEAVHMRFANEYLYVTLKAKDLDPKAIAAPKAFFARDDGAVASVILRIDRVPDDIKTFLLGQIEMAAKQELKKAEGVGNPAERKLKELFFDTLVGGTKVLLADGKELAVRVVIDEKTEDLVLEVNLTPKDGTALAKNIAGMTGKTSPAAGIVATKNPLFLAATKMGMTPDMKKQWDTTVDALAEEIARASGDRGTTERILEPLVATLKAGELDAAVSVSAPDSKGRHVLLAAVGVKDGKQIEKLLKEFAPFVPGDIADITFDVAKVGTFAVHKIEFKDLDANFEKLFGTKTLWVATSDEMLAFGVEPDGKAFRDALAAKPATVGFLSAELALAKALPLLNPELKPDELKALMKDAFGGESPTGKDTITLTVEGGKQLTIRAKVKGKALRLGTTLEQFKVK